MLFNGIYIMRMISFGVQCVLCIYSGDLNFLTEDEIFTEGPSFGQYIPLFNEKKCWLCLNSIVWFSRDIFLTFKTTKNILVLD